MNYKVFMKIFFEKPKYFIIYGLLITTFWYVLFIGVADAIFAGYYEKKVPDIVIIGKVPNNDQSILKQSDSDDIQSFDLAVRDVMLPSASDEHVSCRMYAIEDGFIEELEDYLKKGALPKANENQAVIGSKLAKELNVDVGSTLKLPVKAGEHNTKAYMIAGVLSEKMTYYNDGIYISDTAVSLPHNALYIYCKSENAYYETKGQLKKVDKNSFGDLTFPGEDKVSLSNTIWKALIETIPLSAVFLTALFVSLMKYTGRKIGLMKAIGLNDRNLMTILIKGFGLFNVCGILNSFVGLGCIRLVSQTPLPVSAFLYTICSYAIICLVTVILLYIMCRTISPEKVLNQSGGMAGAV